MTDLVIGGAGFLGSTLVRALVSEGRSVVAMDIREPKDKVAGVRYEVADLRDVEAMKALLSGVTTVYHTASLTETNGPSRLFHDINVVGTQNVVAAAVANDSVKALVYTSSASVVFDGHDIHKGDESLAIPPNHLDAYSASKAEAEAVVLAADGAAAGRLRTAAIRPHTIFGPGDVHVFPRIFANAASGKMKYILGSGTVLHDYTYVDNCAYFITNDEPRNFWETTYWLVNEMGYDASPKFRIPAAVARFIALMFTFIAWIVSPCFAFKPLLTSYVVANVTTSHYFSVDKARKELGYEPKVKLDEAFATTLRWFRDNGYGQ
ncbi:3-beta hydroxysteroid dehydrogenase/isomerase [Thecamonas trahens ATCC 50062]|uniref:3-beta hydroxysteroid dehydrogenase/isomerase n=1 Tax=Thecamonas trahens ATCC 50062 TaxID=461836 RepID=A0A0L0DRH0_THETB|nr:3-beta hydroxysteroid dehydrogenase/isomerase [Thecamonas trahens ATCC 50062]KNC54043.1 3-beta hydroxysteroid dehydrogenase/isomerase [Thecamonas trahens ATCC 50062]|eukprot:XP_013754054.1 3-beta hydroxysteroid dehydrogenase/isomerase [Thecamonas trahens ATCC 50062]